MSAAVIEDDCKREAAGADAPEPSRGKFAIWGPLLSVVDQAIVSGTSFATAVIVGRTCSPDELGFYYLMLTFMIGIAGLQEAAISGPFTIFVARRRGREWREFAGSMWIHHGGLTVIGMALLLGLIAVLTSTGDPKGLVGGFWVLMFTGPMYLLREGVRRFAFARLHMLTAIAVDGAVALVQMAGLLLLWHWEMLTVVNLYLVIGMACLLACLGWYVCEQRASKIVWNRVRKDWTDNWPFAKWSLTSFLVGDTMPLIMPWLIGAVAGAAATGVFGACATLVGMSNVLVLGTGNFLMPKAAKAYAHGGVRALRQELLLIALLFVLVFGVGCVAVVLTGDLLPVLVYGESFAGTGTIFGVLAINALVGSLGMIASNGLLVLGLSRTNFIADVNWFVATIGAALWLVVMNGAVGAALAVLIGTSAGAILRAFALWLALRTAEDMSRASATTSPPSSWLFAAPIQGPSEV